MKKKNIIIIKYLAIGILVFLAINIPKMVISNKIIEGLESDESPSTEINTTG